MKVSLINGNLCLISDDGSVWADNLFAGVEYRDENNSCIIKKSSGKWSLTETENGCTASCNGYSVCFTYIENGIVGFTEFTNTEDDMCGFSDFITLSFNYGNIIDTVLGSEIWRANGNRTNEMQSCVNTTRMVYGQKCEISDFAACRDVNGKEFIFGFLTFDNFFNNVDVYCDGVLSFHQFPEYHSVKHGETVKSDKFYISQCKDIRTALPRYIQEMSDKMLESRNLAKPDAFTVPVGYCTWYYHYSKITGAKVLETLEAIKQYSDKIPLRYFQIDDGWYDCWGNWNTNEKFPGGMKYYADKIKEAGLIPGLWFAPFGASVHSDIYKNHPEYFIRDWQENDVTDGRHLGDWGYYNLDFSVPEVCEYIKNIVHRFTHEWGFKYIKLDIITGSIGPYKHSQPDFNACKNFVRGLQVIREAAGNDAFILACTSPFGGATGLVDGMRVSGDIGGDWNCLNGVFNRVLKRYYYHNTVFANDADCLIIRNAQNEDSDCMLHCTRTDEENKSFISAVAASGGALMLSDKLELLTDEQIKKISYLFPQNTIAAVPLDLMESQTPCVLDLGLRKKIRTIIFINWGSIERSFSAEVGKKHAFDFWEQKYEGITEDIYTATIKPHECKVMFFTDTSTPAVIGTDSEIVPEIRQENINGTLNIHFNKKDEKYTVFASLLQSDDCIIEKIADNLFIVASVSDSNSDCTLITSTNLNHTRRN